MVVIVVLADILVAGKIWAGSSFVTLRDKTTIIFAAGKKLSGNGKNAEWVKNTFSALEKMRKFVPNPRNNIFPDWVWGL